MDTPEVSLTQKAPRIEDPYKRFPGSIKYETNIGCKAVEFASADDMNEFFKVNNGAVVVFLSFTATGRILCLYTIQLTDDEIDIITVRAEIVNKMVEEERQKREDAKREELEREEKDNRERARLQQKGKKCEHDHGGIDREREQFSKLKKALRKTKEGREMLAVLDAKDETE